MKIITVLSQKGGCGKTTTVKTLAVALSAKNYRVGIAETDPQKSITHWFKNRPKQHSLNIEFFDLRKTSIHSNMALDFLIIDTAGTQLTPHIQDILKQTHIIILPTLLSFFDFESTKKYLKRLKKIYKNMEQPIPELLLIANKTTSHNEKSCSTKLFFEQLNLQPTVWISQRTAYIKLAEKGLSLFDCHQKTYLMLQKQWQPLLNQLVNQEDSWF